jgi:hypothetical protein
MKNLESKDDKKVSAALDIADKNGTIQWVEPLLEAFSSREDDELKERMRIMLSSIKLSAAEDVFLEFLQKDGKESVYADVLSFIWSSGFTPNNEIDLIVRCSTTGDFRAAMEGLTIVEQCDMIENEQSLLDAIFSLRSALSSKEKEACHNLYEPMLKKLEHIERNQ